MPSTMGKIPGGVETPVLSMALRLVSRFSDLFVINSSTEPGREPYL